MTEPYPFIDLNYEILSKLREGGMGAVYKVRHRLLGQTRIVKIIRPQMSGDEEVGERFLREARAGSRLRHPNIAFLLDFRIDRDGHEMLVMEYIDGLNLLELLDRHGPPPLGLTLEIARQALAALEYLHRQGIIHRDISPDNLMLTRGPEGEPLVKLIDLGIAKLQAEDHQGFTHPGVFLGKPIYASPEQFLGEGEVDARSDVYSFGIVLYQLLTGHLPFSGKNRRELMTAHLLHSPRPFAEHGPEGRIPDDLCRAVLTALTKDAAGRFSSAQAFSRLLEEIAHRFSVSSDDVDRVLGPPARAETTPGGGAKSPSEFTTHPQGPVVALVDPPSAPVRKPNVSERSQAGGTREVVAPLLALGEMGQSRHRRMALTAALLLASGGVAGIWLLQSGQPSAGLPEPARRVVHSSPAPAGPPPAGKTAPASQPSRAALAPPERKEPARDRPVSPEPAQLLSAVAVTPAEILPQQEPAQEKPAPSEDSGSVPSLPMVDGPARLLEKPEPAYPAEAAASGRSYQITVEVTVDETGAVVDNPSVKPRVTAWKADLPSEEFGLPTRQSPPDPYSYLFRSLALEAARKARFAPAVRNGVPARDKTTLAYEFTPPG